MSLRRFALLFVIVGNHFAVNSNASQFYASGGGLQPYCGPAGCGAASLNLKSKGRRLKRAEKQEPPWAPISIPYEGELHGRSICTSITVFNVCIPPPEFQRATFTYAEVPTPAQEWLENNPNPTMFPPLWVVEELKERPPGPIWLGAGGKREDKTHYWHLTGPVLETILNPTKRSEKGTFKYFVYRLRRLAYNARMRIPSIDEIRTNIVIRANEDQALREPLLANVLLRSDQNSTADRESATNRNSTTYENLSVEISPGENETTPGIDVALLDVESLAKDESLAKTEAQTVHGIPTINLDQGGQQTGPGSVISIPDQTPVLNVMLEDVPKVDKISTAGTGLQATDRTPSTNKPLPRLPPDVLNAISKRLTKEAHHFITPQVFYEFIQIQSSQKPSGFPSFLQVSDLWGYVLRHQHTWRNVVNNVSSNAVIVPGESKRIMKLRDYVILTCAAASANNFTSSSGSHLPRSERCMWALEWSLMTADEARTLRDFFAVTSKDHKDACRHIDSKFYHVSVEVFRLLPQYYQIWGRWSITSPCYNALDGLLVALNATMANAKTKFATFKNNTLLDEKLGIRDRIRYLQTIRPPHS